MEELTSTAIDYNLYENMAIKIHDIQRMIISRFRLNQEMFNQYGKGNSGM